MKSKLRDKANYRTLGARRRPRRTRRPRSGDNKVGTAYQGAQGLAAGGLLAISALQRFGTSKARKGDHRCLQDTPFSAILAVWSGKRPNPEIWSETPILP